MCCFLSYVARITRNSYVLWPWRWACVFCCGNYQKILPQRNSFQVSIINIKRTFHARKCQYFIDVGNKKKVKTQIKDFTCVALLMKWPRWMMSTKIFYFYTIFAFIANRIINIYFLPLLKVTRWKRFLVPSNWLAIQVSDKSDNRNT